MNTVSASFAGWISNEVTPGCLPLNSTLNCSSQSGTGGGPFSTPDKLVTPPVEIAGLRTLTVNVRVSYFPAAVSIFSNIKRRDSHLTVVEVADDGSPKCRLTS